MSKGKTVVLFLAAAFYTLSRRMRTLDGAPGRGVCCIGALDPTVALTKSL